ncbi:MAG: hypothetical protein ABR936_16635 [Bacteroidota bacterium]|jgi:hypothetical protein
MNKQVKYQLKKLEEGLCTSCGKNPLYSSTKCKKCYKISISRQAISDVGRNLRHKKNRNENDIIEDIQRRLLPFKQSDPTLEYTKVTKIFSDIASKRNISLSTIRKIYFNKVRENPKKQP